jgi:hypothetical protein
LPAPERSATEAPSVVALGHTQRAHSLEIAENLGLDMRMLHGVELELLQPPGQQVVRPFAGKNT